MEERGAGHAGAPEVAELTGFLNRYAAGERELGDQILELTLEQLRHIARLLIRRKQRILSTDEFVNEVWLRLFGKPRRGWNDRNHFYAFVARAMRNLLVDYFRQRRRSYEALGGRVPLFENIAQDFDEQGVDVLDAAEQVSALYAIDKRAAQVADLKLFSGLSMPEISEVTELPLRTVERLWGKARQWLRANLS